jgi:hypothetical protein
MIMLAFAVMANIEDVSEKQAACTSRVEVSQAITALMKKGSKP